MIFFGGPSSSMLIAPKRFQIGITGVFQAVYVILEIERLMAELCLAIS